MIPIKTSLHDGSEKEISAILSLIFYRNFQQKLLDENKVLVSSNQRVQAVDGIIWRSESY